MSFIGSPLEKEIFEAIKYFFDDAKIVRTDSDNGLLYVSASKLELSCEEHVFSKYIEALRHIRIVQINDLTIGQDSGEKFLQETFWIPQKRCKIFRVYNDNETQYVTDQNFNKKILNGSISSDLFSLMNVNLDKKDIISKAKKFDLHSVSAAAAIVNSTTVTCVIVKCDLRVKLNTQNLKYLNLNGDNIKFNFEQDSKLENCEIVSLKRIPIDSFKNLPVIKERFSLDNIGGMQHHVLNAFVARQKVNSGFIVSDDKTTPLYHLKSISPSSSIYDTAAILLEAGFDEDIVSF